MHSPEAGKDVAPSATITPSMPFSGARMAAVIVCDLFSVIGAAISASRVEPAVLSCAHDGHRHEQAQRRAEMRIDRRGYQVTR